MHPALFRYLCLYTYMHHALFSCQPVRDSLFKGEGRKPSTTELSLLQTYEHLEEWIQSSSSALNLRTPNNRRAAKKTWA